MPHPDVCLFVAIRGRDMIRRHKRRDVRSAPKIASRAYNRLVLTRIEVGLDLVEIDRIKRILERHGERFLTRVYTEREILDSEGRTESLAARFAAKEAVMKALGTGAMDFRDIE